MARSGGLKDEPGTSCVNLSFRTPILHFDGRAPRSSSRSAGASVAGASRVNKLRHERRGCFCWLSPSSTEAAMRGGDNHLCLKRVYKTNGF
jgi:hypothetical protein